MDDMLKNINILLSEFYLGKHFKQPDDIFIKEEYYKDDLILYYEGIFNRATRIVKGVFSGTVNKTSFNVQLDNTMYIIDLDLIKKVISIHNKDNLTDTEIKKIIEKIYYGIDTMMFNWAIKYKAR